MTLNTQSKVLLTIFVSVFMFVAALLLSLLSDSDLLFAVSLGISMVSGINLGRLRDILEHDWRSVEVELPSRRGRYLVNLNGSIVDIVAFYNGEWCDSEKAQCITHWKPIPRKPNSEC